VTLLITVKAKLSYDRRSVGQSILVSGHHLGPPTKFSFTSMENIFRYLRFPSCVAPFLTRRRACNLSVQVLLGLASAITLRSKSRRTRDNILLSHLRLSSPFVASYDSQDCSGGILSPLHRCCSRPTLHSFGTDRREIISSNVPVVLCVSIGAIAYQRPLT
jgi:hypothetical protein